MFRAVLGVVAGYVAMGVFVAVTFFGAIPVLGIETIYKPGLYESSLLWLEISFALTAIGAVIGGVVCRAIAKRPRPVGVLAGLVLAFGLLTAVTSLLSERPELPPRPADATMQDIAQHSRQPVLTLVLNPIIGAAGIAVAGRLYDRPKAA